MSFPLWYLLIIYGLFLVIAGLFFLANFFHIAKFGLQSFKTAIVLMFYIGAFAVVVLINLNLISMFDWSQVIELNVFGTSMPGL